MNPGSGRSSGEGIGYPLQYSWASLVTQLGKNPSAMWETWVRSLCWEDALEKGKATQLQYSGLENSMDCRVCGISESDMTEQLSFSLVPLARHDSVYMSIVILNPCFLLSVWLWVPFILLFHSASY